MAGDEGFEPPITGPEPGALPLGQSPTEAKRDKLNLNRLLISDRYHKILANRCDYTSLAAFSQAPVFDTPTTIMVVGLTYRIDTQQRLAICTHATIELIPIVRIITKMYDVR